MHRPLPKSYGVRGAFWDNTMGRLVVKRSTESLVHSTFTLHSRPHLWPAMRERPLALLAFVMHHPVLIIAKNGGELRGRCV